MNNNINQEDCPRKAPSVEDFCNKANDNLVGENNFIGPDKMEERKSVQGTITGNFIDGSQFPPPEFTQFLQIKKDGTYPFPVEASDANGINTSRPSLLKKNEINMIDNRDESMIHNIPYNMNKFVLVFVLFLYVVCVGPQFFNWTSWENILQRNGIYKEYCKGNNCDLQKESLAFVFYLFNLFMFSFSFIAGMILDIVGPRICCFSGVSILIVAWFFFSFAVHNSFWCVLSFCLVGAGTDMAFFGILTTMNIFPKHTSTIIAIFGAARSMCNGWPLLVDIINKRYASYNLTYIGVTFTIMYIICMFIVVLFVPKKPYVNLEEQQEKIMDSIDDVVVKDVESITLTERTSHSKSAFNRIMFEIKDLKNYLVNPIYIGVIILTCLNIIRNSYYLTMAPLRFGDAVSVLSIMNFLAFIPTPICGYFANHYSPTFVIHVINFSVTLAFLLSLISAVIKDAVWIRIIEITSVAFVYPFISFLLSQVYCYIADVFPSKDLGKLLGFANCIGAFIGLSSKFMIDKGEDIKRNSFILTDIIAVSMGVFAAFIIQYLRIKARNLKK